MSQPDFLKQISVQFYLMNCAVCSIPHYIPDHKYKKANQGDSWFCPNGHSLILGENELEKERKRRKWAEESRDNYQKWFRQEERKRIALKGVLTKTKNRISNGVCPCCKRSFQNLKNHMLNKHPQYKLKNEISRPAVN